MRKRTLKIVIYHFIFIQVFTNKLQVQCRSSESSLQSTRARRPSAGSSSYAMQEVSKSFGSKAMMLLNF